MAASTDGWSIYLEHALKQIDHEHQQRSSLFSRAVAVISTCGIILSVLFGLERAFGPGLKEISPWLLRLLLIAVGCFLLAAVTAVTILVPRRAQWHIELEVLRNGLNHEYGDEEPRDVQQRIAADVVGSVESIRKSNKNGFLTLTVALAFEVVGIGTVGAIAGWILWSELTA